MCKKCGACCGGCRLLIIGNNECSIYDRRIEEGWVLCPDYPSISGNRLFYGCGYIEHWGIKEDRDF